MPRPQAIAAALAVLALTAALPAHAKGRPHSVLERRDPDRARVQPVAPPAPDGPQHVPAGLVLCTFGVEEDGDVIAPDDRPGDPSWQPPGEGSARAIPAPASASAFGANVRINTLVGTPATNGESEVSMAALGARMIGGWNDGQFFATVPGFVGWGWSSNGGTSWTDAGALPTQGLGDVFYGDPVTVADPAGHWYMADLWRPSGGSATTGITVSHATWSGASPVFGAPVVIATSPTDYLDKPWLAVDPASGIVFIAYVRFFGAGGQRIEFSRSLDHGATWSVPVAMTVTATSYPMAPRLQVGPSGELYLAYYANDRGDGEDYLRVRQSTDQGVSFGPEHNIGGRPYWNNYFSGPAGYNRERVVALVSIDVDRSSSPRRGTLYAAWHEGLNVNADALGSAGIVAETEPNETSAQATPFTPGQRLNGALASTADQDWWSFSGTAGQTVILNLVANGSSCNGYLRMFAGGGATANRCGFSHFNGGFAVVEFTLPSTATYYVRVLNWDGIASNIGAYSIYTGVHTPNALDVARDHRDVLCSRSSDGGTTWSAPVLVNDDPPRFDDTFPELACDAAGRVHVSWYDHRDDPANGILTSMYATRSDDGGKTFLPSAKFSTGAAVNWNNVATNLFPNMGDYQSLVTDGMNVYANWSDGRDGTPDSYFCRLVDASTAVGPAPNAVPRTLAVRGLRPLAGGQVRVLLSLPAAGAADAELVDLAGRRVDARSLAGAGAGDHVLALGEGLAPGMYFVRVTQAGAAASAKAVAVR